MRLGKAAITNRRSDDSNTDLKTRTECGKLCLSGVRSWPIGSHPTPGTVSRKRCVHPGGVPRTASMVLSPRAGYRIMKKAGSAINRTMKQTKAATSILLPLCLATDRGFRRRGFLIYDTRASGPKFNRVHRVAPLVGGGGGD